MKKHLLLSALLSALFLFARCEYDATPDAFKMFEHSDYSSLGRGEAVVQNKQGGYTIAGTNTDPVTLRNTIYVAQADRNGEITSNFTRLFEEFSDQETADMCLTKEGNVAVLGRVRTTANAPTQFFLSITDLLGNPQITPKVIDLPVSDGNAYGNALVQNQNGEFLLLGSIYSGASTGSDLYVVKTKANGATIRNQSIPLAGSQYALDICDFGNGTYLLLGLSQDSGGPYRLFFWLIDNNGTPITSSPIYSGPSGASFSGGRLALNPDGSVMAASAMRNGVSTNQLQVYLAKIEANGELPKGFPQTFDVEGPLSVNDIHTALDGSGFVIAGHLNGKAYVLKTNLDGTKIFNKTYGGPSDYALGSAPTSDGGFILSGVKDFTASDPSRGKLYLVKADPAGNTR